MWLGNQVNLGLDKSRVNIVVADTVGTHTQGRPASGKKTHTILQDIGKRGFGYTKVKENGVLAKQNACALEVCSMPELKIHN